MNRKTVLILVSILVAINFYAQESKKNIKTDSLKIRAGVNYGQNALYGKNSVTTLYHTIQGEMSVEIPLKWNFGVETGVKYDFSKGKKNEIYPHNGIAKYDYTRHTITIPANITYTTPTLFWNIKLFLFVGPKLNIGLVQNNTINFNQDSNKGVTNPLNYPKTGDYNTYADFQNRFNIQLGAGGGIEWKFLRAKSGYDWGVNNLNKNREYSEHTRGWFVGIEYQF